MATADKGLVAMGYGLRRFSAKVAEGGKAIEITHKRPIIHSQTVCVSPFIAMSRSVSRSTSGFLRGRTRRRFQSRAKPLQGILRVERCSR